MEPFSREAPGLQAAPDELEPRDEDVRTYRIDFSRCLIRRESSGTP